MKENKEIKKQIKILLYKLLHDALFLWLLVFGAFLISEALLPGYLTAHIGFSKLIAAFFALGISAAWLGKRNELYFKTIPIKEFLKNKTMLLLIPILIVLTIISLRKFENIEIVIITSVTAAIFYYLLNIFNEAERS